MSEFSDVAGALDREMGSLLLRLLSLENTVRGLVAGTTREEYTWKDLQGRVEVLEREIHTREAVGSLKALDAEKVRGLLLDLLRGPDDTY